KRNRCTLENHKLSCGIPWEDRTESDGFCRCDYKHGYAPFNEDVSMCFYSREECYIQNCSSGHGLVSNYSCVSVCPQGYYHENTSRQCLPVISSRNIAYKTEGDCSNPKRDNTWSASSYNYSSRNIAYKTEGDCSNPKQDNTWSASSYNYSSRNIAYKTEGDCSNPKRDNTWSAIPETTPTPSISVTVFGIVSSITLLLIVFISVDAGSCTTKAMNSGHKNAGLVGYDLVTFDTKHRKDKTDPAKTKLAL
ncbi:hypothetical protein MAR_005565, partial [Mya arenaria]